MWGIIADGCASGRREKHHRTAGDVDRSGPGGAARGALGLSRLGADARDAVPDLIPLLKCPNALTRQNAALALAAIGADARVAVAALTDALKDSEWAVRRQAALAAGSNWPGRKKRRSRR